jgi:hypothetical protein
MAAGWRCEASSASRVADRQRATSSRSVLTAHSADVITADVDTIVILAVGRQC